RICFGFRNSISGLLRLSAIFHCYLINTSLERGAPRPSTIHNRFSGFSITHRFEPSLSRRNFSGGGSLQPRSVRSVCYVRFHRHTLAFSIQHLAFPLHAFSLSAQLEPSELANVPAEGSLF